MENLLWTLLEGTLCFVEFTNEVKRAIHVEKVMLSAKAEPLYIVARNNDVYNWTNIIRIHVAYDNESIKDWH